MTSYKTKLPVWYKKLEGWNNGSMSSTNINPSIKTARYVFLELSVRQLLVPQDPKDVNIFYQGKISKDGNLF